MCFHAFLHLPKICDFCPFSFLPNLKWCELKICYLGAILEWQTILLLFFFSWIWISLGFTNIRVVFVGLLIFPFFCGVYPATMLFLKVIKFSIRNHQNINFILIVNFTSMEIGNDRLETPPFFVRFYM